MRERERERERESGRRERERARERELVFQMLIKKRSYSMPCLKWLVWERRDRVDDDDDENALDRNWKRER